MKSIKMLFLFIVASMILLAISREDSIAQSYSFTSLDGNYVSMSINNMNQIAGAYYGVSGQQGFIYDGTVYTLFSVPNAQRTFAYGINNNGTVVGTYINNNMRHGFIYDGSSYRFLDYANAIETQAYGINDHGKVVGYYYSGSLGGHGFVYDMATDVYTPVNVPGASRTFARGINNYNVIAGTYYDSMGEHGFIFDGTTYKTIDFPGVPTSIVNDINDFDKIVGFYDHALLYGFYAAPDVPVAKAVGAQTVHAGSVVTLDGSASYDQNGYYPLTYSWIFKEKPIGSTATLSNPGAVNPSFITDIPGDYVIELIVKNNVGSSSAPDTVRISTTNTAPTADAGTDQAIITIGSTVQLNGIQSYDLDGDSITWSWSIINKPTGSNAVLSNPVSPVPTFIVDVYGDYVFSLIVNDAWTESQPAEVTVSFNNIKPVADAGGNQSVLAGDVVTLDGGRSADANGDSLTYHWGIASRPEGSIAAITQDILPSMASFVADKPGTYVVSLVVNDGFIDSEPNNSNVVAVTVQSAAIYELNEAIWIVNHIDPEGFKNKNLQNALTNKITAVISMIDQGLFRDALNKLENDILNKTDGCLVAGLPDKNDWLINCNAQGLVSPLITRAIALLRLL